MGMIVNNIRVVGQKTYWTVFSFLEEDAKTPLAF